MVRGERVQVDDGAAAVVGVLAPVDEADVLELPRQLARGRQGQAELPGELPDRPLALRPDLGEDGDVAAREAVAVGQGEQLVGRPPALPEAAHHPAQVAPQLLELPAFRYHLRSVII